MKKNFSENVFFLKLLQIFFVYNGCESCEGGHKQHFGRSLLKTYIIMYRNRMKWFLGFQFSGTEKEKISQPFLSLRSRNCTESNLKKW